MVPYQKTGNFSLSTWKWERVLQHRRRGQNKIYNIYGTVVEGEVLCLGEGQSFTYSLTRKLGVVPDVRLMRWWPAWRLAWRRKCWVRPPLLPATHRIQTDVRVPCSAVQFPGRSGFPEGTIRVYVAEHHLPRGLSSEQSEGEYTSKGYGREHHPHFVRTRDTFVLTSRTNNLFLRYPF